MSEVLDVAIVGAGVVGLACAAVLAEAGLEVLVIERHPSVGQETTSRNSGVIHAGLYYEPGSLKAQLCVEGRRLLVQRCERDAVDYSITGKLVVASDTAEIEQLRQLENRGKRNGAGELRLIGKAELRELEPHVTAEAALLSPETGIVDVHGLLGSYLRQAQRAGARLSLRTAVTKLERGAHRWTVSTVDAQGDRFSIEAKRVVNAAGLAAPAVAASAGLDVGALGYVYHLCRGDYFALAPRYSRMVRHLIYPLPVAAGLGIHLSRDLGGRVLAGPDAEYVTEVDYTPAAHKRGMFASAIRRYLPELRDEDLTADTVGVRPKLQAPGERPRDFVVAEGSANGAPGLVNLIGIESPGVTASEAIARHVAAMWVSQALA